MWEDIFLIKESFFNGLTWSSDGAYVYWTDRSGLNRIHIETRKAEMVRRNCGNDRFYQITFDNQGNLYAIREIGKVLNGDEYFETRPVRFDFNNCVLEDITHSRLLHAQRYHSRNEVIKTKNRRHFQNAFCLNINYFLTVPSHTSLPRQSLHYLKNERHQLAH